MVKSVYPIENNKLLYIFYLALVFFVKQYCVILLYLQLAVFARALWRNKWFGVLSTVVDYRIVLPRTTSRLVVDLLLLQMSSKTFQDMNTISI